MPRLFRITHKKRYWLVLLMFVAGGGGIFSEESVGYDPFLSIGFTGRQPLMVRLQQKDFVVFRPIDYFVLRKTKVKTPLPKQKTLLSIMGQGKLKASALAAFLHQNNNGISIAEAYKIAKIYIEESNAEGVNSDIAFSQMCLETGFLRYSGTVLPGQNNFGGLGVLNRKTKGFSFRDIRLGIRAQIQHLKAYASLGKLHHDIVDPRFRFIKRGSIKDVDALAGKWAADKRYGKKIRYLLSRMYHEKVKI
ncbi:MAG: hypothetical protein IEMM0006_0559 [bacterium]|nr:MAG: hypothetical protein IEMM0006_0559 [bacterium]